MAEAMRSLEQIPELQPENGEPHPVIIQGVDSEFALYAHTTLEEIHVHPHTGGGGGRNGLLQILIGVALIAIGIWNPAFLASTGLLSANSLFLAGGLMVAGGILQMLAPKPDDDEERTSNYLNAQGNTVGIGTPIPIGYGTAKIGGHFLSFDVDAKNVSNGPLGSAAAVSQTVLRDISDQAYVTAITLGASSTPVYSFDPLSGVGDDQVIELTVPGYDLVRYLYIEGAPDQFLQLSEVEIFGFDPITKLYDQDITSIYAPSMVVTMSSQTAPENGGATLLDGNSATFAQTSNGPSEWIRIDLGANLQLTRIRIRSTALSGNRLDGATVSLWDYLGVGTVVTESLNESFFSEVDRTPVPLAVVSPIYTSATPGPLNVPTSAWID